MRTLSAISQNPSIEILTTMDAIVGGKKNYGLVKYYSADTIKFLTSGFAVTSISLVGAKSNIIRMENAAGDEICVEW